MSDNEDLLGDDLGDHSLADYNLGNEEEEQLLADDYESLPQNVPTSLGSRYGNGVVPAQFQGHSVEYGPPMAYQPVPEAECVVPNITVEVSNPPPENVHCTYSPYEPDRAVPPAIPAGPIESPQIVPSDINPNVSNGDMGGPRERFMSERPPGAQRLPQVRDIPDSLDKVVIPRGGFPGRGRTTWVRHNHPYRRNYRGNYNQRVSYPPSMRLNQQHLRHDASAELRLNLRIDNRHEMRPHLQLRPEIDPVLLPDLRPDIRMDRHPDMRPEIHPDLRPEMRMDRHPDMRVEIRPDMGSDIRPDLRPEMRPDLRPELRHDLRPEMHPDLRPELRHDLRPEMRPNLRPEMRSDIHMEMRPELHPELRQELRSDLQSEMRANMRPDLRPEMHLDLHPEMRLDLRPDMRTDMRSDMRLDMHRELRPDIHPDIHPDMRPNLRSEIRPDVRPEMRSDLRPEMRSDLHSDIRPDLRPEMRADFRPEIHPDLRPEMRPDLRPDLRPEMHPEHLAPPRQMGPNISPERPILPEMQPPSFRQQNLPRFQYRQPIEERPLDPNLEPRPMLQYQRPFPQPMVREITPNSLSHMPQVTIRQAMPNVAPIDKDKFGMKIEPEVRMLPVQLPPNLPPSLPGKKVLINPHFKGNFQPPIEGLPAYIPTRIQKTPPLSPTLENKFGPIKDIDDAAERFIAEQRNALARAAGRKFTRRSPQRYIENTTIEIENELAVAASGRRRSEDDDLLRRQEEFINANRAGLRRRMRSPSPPRRSPSPERRARVDPHRHPPDEESEYRRRLREQERLRERVLRAKEVRRKKNAVAIQEREREILEKEKVKEPLKVEKPEDKKPEQTVDKPTSTESEVRPDTTRNSPEDTEKPNNTGRIKTERVRERSPLTKDDSTEVNSTCETMTPPRAPTPEPERALTPPLPPAITPTGPSGRTALDSDDELDLILEDIDGILSEDDDDKLVPPPKSTSQSDLRTKLPPKSNQTTETKKSQRQKIIFSEKDDKKKKEKSPPRKPVVSSTKTDVARNEKKPVKTPQKTEASTLKNRQRIVFDNKKEKSPGETEKKQFSSNRRVILQKKDNKSVFTRIETKPDPSKPNPGIFSRAVRTAIGADRRRGAGNAGGHELPEPHVEYGTDSEPEEGVPTRSETGAGGRNTATVSNLPHGITDTRLRTLAGNLLQSLILDKEDRSAKITFKTSTAAETFKKKFNNKMVAASRLSVTLL